MSSLPYPPSPVFSHVSSPLCPHSPVLSLLHFIPAVSPSYPLPLVLFNLSSLSYPLTSCISSYSVPLTFTLSIMSSPSSPHPYCVPTPFCPSSSVLFFRIIFLPVLFVMSPYSCALSFLPFVIYIMSSPCSPLPPLPQRKS